MFDMEIIKVQETYGGEWLAIEMEETGMVPQGSYTTIWKKDIEGYWELVAA